MVADEPVTAAEKYARAVTSGQLALKSDARCDADVLLAAGYAAQGDPRRMLALSIYRMCVTQDTRDLWTIVEAADGWLAGHLTRGGNRPMRKEQRRALIVDVLHWVMHPGCDYCGATGVIAAEGTAGKLTTACTACHGSGKRPLARAVPHAHVKPAQWLADELAKYVGIVTGDMAKRLARELPP